MNSSAQQKPHSQHQPKVLIVDDDEMNWHLYKIMLDNIGVSSEAASGGDEALRLLTSQSFAMVITDYYMPAMDGEALARAIKRQPGWRNIPVILSTGSPPDEPEKIRLKKSGVDDFLTKPFTLHDLKTVVHNWLPQNDSKSNTTVQAGSTSGENEGATTDCPIDTAALAEFAGGDVQMQQALLKKFLTTLKRNSQDMRAAYSARCIEEVGRLAHKLKSPARAVGANKLAELCFVLEQTGKQGRWDSARALEDRIEREINKVENYIKAL